MATATAHPDWRLISSEDVEGTTVYDMSGNQIGSVDHLMIDKVSGRVAFAVMSFGGFLGLGHSHYPIPWGALTSEADIDRAKPWHRYDTGLDGYKTNVTEAQLRDAPEFSDDSWADRDWQRRTYSHYNVQPYW